MVQFFKKNMPIILVTLIFLVIGTSFIGVDPDVYWHIKTGEWVLENGIPRQDPFSYWGGNFIAHEWLYDVILYSVYSVTGFFGAELILLFGVLTTALVISMKISQGKSNPNAIIYLLPIYWVVKYAGLLTTRPHMMSLLFICLELLILEKKNDKLYWLFPLFTLFITNVHGGSIAIFILIFVIHLVSYIYDNWGNIDKKFVVKNIIITVIMAGTMLINPYGIESVLYGTKIPQEAMEYITEWYPLVMGAKDIPMLFLTLIPLACMSYSKKAKLIDILMICMGFMMTLVWCRMILIYACICIIYGSDVLNKLGINKIKIPNVINKKIISAILAITLIYLLAISVSNISLERLESESKVSPTIIKEYILENDIDVKNNIMFNNYNFGGYFIFNNMKVFMDGRNDVYCEEFGSPDVLPDYFSISRAESNAEDLIKEYNIKYFAIYKDSGLHSYLLDNDLAEELVSDENYVFLELKNN